MPTVNVTHQEQRMDPRLDISQMAICAVAGLAGGAASAWFTKELPPRQFGAYMFGGFVVGGFGSAAVCKYHNMDPGLAVGVALGLGIGVRVVIVGIQKVLEAVITATVNRQNKE